MWPTTKEPRREMFLVIGALINALGGYKAVAAECLVSIESVNKWKQNPHGNGQDIPVKHLQTILAYAGREIQNHAAQLAADELIQDHFCNLFHRRLIPEEELFKVIEALSGIARQQAKAVNQ